MHYYSQWRQEWLSGKALECYQRGIDVDNLTELGDPCPPPCQAATHRGFDPLHEHQARTKKGQGIP